MEQKIVNHIESDIIFPIGKYKGVAMTEVLKDSGYCIWCLQQHWFKSRYPDAHAVLIAEQKVLENTFTELTEQEYTTRRKIVIRHCIKILIKQLEKRNIEPTLQTIVDELADEFYMEDVRECYKDVTGKMISKIRTKGRTRKYYNRHNVTMGIKSDPNICNN